ncbi:xylose isomerase [Thraustotheca clavata]|uniref:Xylose isomerase n=1 Tax=Thraustotheca clavata TaxID=74557 RepID=A0A1W0A7Q1_9STRA|nr:xylose isomerase [Thraustotheca clavata]
MIQQRIKGKLLVFAPHWGSAHLSREIFLQKVVKAGFDGVEMSLPLDKEERNAWTSAIADAGLQLIAQQWETVMHSDFNQHKKAMIQYLENAAAAKPRFINTHTGKDWYNIKQNTKLIKLASEISSASGISIVHEIHRSRFSGHPMLLLPYLTTFPNLALNADLSHWCVACESLLEDQPHILEKVFPNVQHIHARVGHSQGPQVNDFRAPEHKQAFKHHVNWWDAILKIQEANGRTEHTITPEFGPSPYTQTLPYTNQDVSNAWDLNVAMLHLLKERYVNQLD